MSCTSQTPEEDQEDNVLHCVLRQSDRSRRNTYTIRVPLVLQRKLLLSTGEQTTIADGNAEKLVSDVKA